MSTHLQVALYLLLANLLLKLALMKWNLVWAYMVSLEKKEKKLKSADEITLELMRAILEDLKPDSNQKVLITY